MNLRAAIGRSQELDGRLAGSRAARQALDLIGGSPVQFGFITVSYQHSIQAVLSGVSAMLGNTPVLGMSVFGDMDAPPQQSRTVQVALLAGEGLQARSDFWPGFDLASSGAIRKLMAEFGLAHHDDGLLLLVADGLNGDAGAIESIIGKGDFPIAGALAYGLPMAQKSYQIGGSQSGSGGLAAARLTGTGESQIVASIGLAQGWKSTGAVFEVTNVRGNSIRALDHRPAIEIYANTFGTETQVWTKPPLNELVRLYPLGVEMFGAKDLSVHSPLLFEKDGGLKLQTKIPTNTFVHLMLGNRNSCIQATRLAATQALEKLQGAQPVLGLVFADQSWQYLFESEPGQLSKTILKEIGHAVPLLGGFSLGQLARPLPGEETRVYFQHLLLLLIGERANTPFVNRAI